MKASFGENLFFGAIGEIVEDGHWRSFLVEGVMQALGMNRHSILAILGNAPILDPVRVVGKACDLFVLHVEFEETHGRGMVRVVDDFRIIFLLFEGLLVGAGIFLAR